MPPIPPPPPAPRSPHSAPSVPPPPPPMGAKPGTKTLPPPPPPMGAPKKHWREKMIERPSLPRTDSSDRIHWKGGPSAVANVSTNWTKLSAVSASTPNPGSSGVFFARFKARGGGCVIVKGCSTVAQEAFSCRLLNMCRPNAAPICRVLSWPGGEWSTMCQSIVRFFEHDPVSETRAKKELNRPFILVQEYIPGVMLESISSEFGQETAIKIVNSSQLLESIGWLLSMDVWMNNWDRLPSSVFANEGNARNLLLTGSLATSFNVVGIDQAVTKISRGYEHYLHSVTEFATDLFFSDGAKALKQTVTLLSSIVGQPLKPAALESLRRGAIQGMRAVASVDPVAIASMKKDLANEVKTDWEHVWRSMMDQIDTEFLSAVANIFRQAIYTEHQGSLLHPMPATVKIALCQCTSMHPQEAVAYVDSVLRAETRPIDLIVMPECWLTGGGAKVSLDSPVLAGLSKVAQQHNCFISAGTMIEQTEDRSLYVTTVLIGSDGQIRGSYQKQCLPHHSKWVKPGSKSFVCDSALGRLGIAICFDIENLNVLKQTLAHAPTFILNPSFVTAADESETSWVAAQRGNQRRFELSVQEHGWMLARCDQPLLAGARGTSMFLAPSVSFLAPSPKECVLLAVVEAYGPSNQLLVPEPHRWRTAAEDNTGNRFHVRAGMPVPRGTTARCLFPPGSLDKGSAWPACVLMGKGNEVSVWDAKHGAVVGEPATLPEPVQIMRFATQTPRGKDGPSTEQIETPTAYRLIVLFDSGLVGAFDVSMPGGPCWPPKQIAMSLEAQMDIVALHSCQSGTVATRSRDGSCTLWDAQLHKKLIFHKEEVTAAAAVGETLLVAYNSGQFGRITAASSEVTQERSSPLDAPVERRLIVPIHGTTVFACGLGQGAVEILHWAQSGASHRVHMLWPLPGGDSVQDGSVGVDGKSTSWMDEKWVSSVATVQNNHPVTLRGMVMGGVEY